MIDWQWRVIWAPKRPIIATTQAHTTAAKHPRLRIGEGKCVWEVRPKDGWNKGDALSHLTIRLGLAPDDVLYLGDDVTDEYAFRAAPDGLTFHVGGAGEETAAQYRIRDTAGAQAFLLCVLGVRSGRHAPELEPRTNDRATAVAISENPA